MLAVDCALVEMGCLLYPCYPWLTCLMKIIYIP
jgi:hypothetical protein